MARTITIHHDGTEYVAEETEPGSLDYEWVEDYEHIPTIVGQRLRETIRRHGGGN